MTQSALHKLSTDELVEQFTDACLAQFEAELKSNIAKQNKLIERDGFSREVIHSPDNLVKVPRKKHHDINGWYQRPNADFNWQTPREYLSGRNWNVRRSVGLEALRIHGVLKP